VESEPGEITRLLRAWQSGDRQAESQLFQKLMPDLRKIAGRCFRGERPGHTLQPTALVNEAFLRLAAAKNIEWRDRGHFFALTARIMRHYLIDYARSKPTINFLPIEGLPEHVLGNRSPLELVIAIDALLNELETQSHQRRVIVELKFFFGMTDEEAAGTLDLHLHTFQREWYRARRWLYEHLTGEICKAAPKTISA
jgi:RNA polymerase sigma factor (TIGR02999 family)